MYVVHLQGCKNIFLCPIFGSIKPFWYQVLQNQKLGTKIVCFMRTEFLCISVLRSRVKFAGCKSALNSPTHATHPVSGGLFYWPF